MSSQNSSDSTPNPAGLRSILDKDLIFSLGSGEFGIQVLHIKETIGPQRTAEVLSTLSHIQGGIDLCNPLCDKALSVADLSLTFDFTPRAYTDRTCIVVIRTHPAGLNPGKERLTSTIADGVSEVLTIAAEDIELSPDFGDGAPLPYLLGMAKVRGKVKLLLNTAQHFSTDTLLKLPGD